MSVGLGIWGFVGTQEFRQLRLEVDCLSFNVCHDETLTTSTAVLMTAVDRGCHHEDSRCSYGWTTNVEA